MPRHVQQSLIHGRTAFNDKEWNALKKAARNATSVKGVRIQETHRKSKRCSRKNSLEAVVCPSPSP
jgi:hypothetical protein